MADNILRGTLSTTPQNMSGNMPGHMIFGVQGPVGPQGPQGDDYVLTPADKKEIAEMAAELVKAPESGGDGDVDLTGYATEQYVKEYAQPKGNYLTEVPDGYAKTSEIPKKPEDIGAQPAGNYALKSELPSVPVQSVNGKTGAVKLSASDVGARPDSWMPTAQDVGALPSTYTPPNQTAEQVGADPKGTAASAVSQHNTAEDSHNDIRLELKAINARLTAFFDSDDQTLDELSEIVAYITSNKALIDSITTSKVSVADIINNLVTNVSNKPLSAAQGVVLKGLIDTVSNSLANYQPKGDYALRSELATAQTQIVTTTGDGQVYVAEVPGIDALTVGAHFIMIPNANSRKGAPKLNVNGLGEKTLRMTKPGNSYMTASPSNVDWLRGGLPVMVMYDGTYWRVLDMQYIDAEAFRGLLTVAKGGTGAGDTATAATNLHVVSYDAQTLTDEQKAQVRENIGVDSGGNPPQTETIETWQTLQGGTDYTVLAKTIAINRPSGTYLLSDNASHSMAEVNVSTGEKYALTLTVKQSTSADYPSVCLLFTDGSGATFLNPDTYGYDEFCGATSSATTEKVTDYEVTVPDGATKMFVCPRVSGETPIVKKYVTMQIEVDNTSAMVSPLYGKKAVFAGDSICAGLTDETGVRGWAQRIGEKYAMDWQNKAISGGTITSGVEDSAGCIGDTDFGDSPDYIIIEGGVNDADLIGEADTNGNMPEKFGTVSMHQFTGEFDNTKFCDAVNALFRRVVTDYKGAKIGFIVAHKMGGYADTSGAGFFYTADKNNRRYYFETIIQLCKKWGIPYLDLWEGCYLNPMLDAHNSGDDPFYNNSDFQHLRAKGYDYITPMIARWMETL